MSDIVLRIYNDASGWPNLTTDLQYTISGSDLLSYNINLDQTNQKGRAIFILDDSNGQWQGKIGKSTPATEWVWRAFALDGTLIPGASGPIFDVRDQGNTIKIVGDCLADLLYRRAITNLEFPAKTAEYILVDTTAGILQGSSNGLLPAATYGTFDLATDVDTPSNNLSKGALKPEGVFVGDYAIELANTSYGAGSRNFDLYLYETFDASATPQFEVFLFFKERTSEAVSIAITPENVSFANFQFGSATTSQVSDVLVYGRFDHTNPQPNDYDYWTDQADPTTFWTGSANTTISADATPKHYGTTAVEAKLDTDFQPFRLDLDLDDAQAFNAASFDTDRFVNGSGYKMRSEVEQYLTFFLQTSETYGAKPLNMIVYLDGVAYEQKALKYVSSATLFTEFTFKLNDLIGFQDGGFIDLISWEDPDGVWEENNNFKIDKLYFWEKGQAIGQYNPGGGSTFRRDLIVNDSQGESDVDCGELGEGYANANNSAEYNGTVTLEGADRDFTLKPGNTFSINYPQKGINVAKVPIQGIVYTPDRQTLVPGRMMSRNEIINKVNRKNRLSISPLQR